jgi:hypothetical protein
MVGLDVDRVDLAPEQLAAVPSTTEQLGDLRTVELEVGDDRVGAAAFLR